MAPDVTPCRTCGGPLEGAAVRIGVCVECIASPRHPAVNLPRPQYGRPKESDHGATPPRPE